MFGMFGQTANHGRKRTLSGRSLRGVSHQSACAAGTRSWRMSPWKLHALLRKVLDIWVVVKIMVPFWSLI